MLVNFDLRNVLPNNMVVIKHYFAEKKSGKAIIFQPKVLCNLHSIKQLVII